MTKISGLSNLMEEIANEALGKWTKEQQEKKDAVIKAVEKEFGVPKLLAKLKELTGKDGYYSPNPDSPVGKEIEKRTKAAGVQEVQSYGYTSRPQGFSEFLLEQKIRLATIGSTEAVDFIKEFRAGLAKLLG
jgi:hypothetical protein